MLSFLLDSPKDDGGSPILNYILRMGWPNDEGETLQAMSHALSNFKMRTYDDRGANGAKRVLNHPPSGSFYLKKDLLKVTEKVK